MPRKRTHNRHLPPRVYIRHGAFYFYPVKKDNTGKTIMNSNGKPVLDTIRLGSIEDYSGAMKKWAEVSKPLDSSSIMTMNQLFDRYMIEVSPLKKSHKSELIKIKHLRGFFGEMRIEDVTSQHVRQYKDLRKAKPVSANREKSLLSHIFTMACDWGLLNLNPCTGVKRFTEIPRKRYVTDKEFYAVRDIATMIMPLIMEYALLTGQREGDILKTKLTDLLEGGVLVIQGKRGKEITLAWTDELRALVDRIKEFNRSRQIASIYLFPTRTGQPYTESGFQSNWQRTINKALKENIIQERFHFHDFKAKFVSDHKDIENASKAAGHSSVAFTNKVYNRKPIVVMPLR